jgi:aspartyl-tRNA(Asn)/glutamyl-tRNA(Gln) amidotransferase subunit A
MRHQAAVESALEAIRRWNPVVNALITVTADEARRAAALADAAEDAGEWRGLLHGVPVAFKDCIDVAGMRCTNGSGRYRDRMPAADAEIARRVGGAGAITVGKTNLNEFCYGATGENVHFGAALNPWDPARITGGSSSGTAAAVASGMCRIGIGTDTGGSVRVPAALCGIAALRPTIGRLPNTGVQEVSVAFDTVGPMAYSVADVARCYAVGAGYDPADPNSVDRPVEDVLAGLHGGIAGLRIGLPRRFFFEGLQPAVERAVLAATQELEAAGAKLMDIDIPDADQAQANTMGALLVADAADVHRDAMTQAPESFGSEVLRRLRLGLGTTGMDYARSLRWLGAWKVKLRAVFAHVDAVVTPTAPLVAPRLANSADMIEATRHVSRFTYGVGAAGLPGLSVPVGFDGDGMPIGMQVLGSWFAEATVLRIGAAYQARTAFHRARPRLPGQLSTPAARNAATSAAP